MRLLAAVLALSITLLGTVVPAVAQPYDPQSAWLDDNSLGAIALVRPNKSPLVAISPLAHALNWNASRSGSNVVLRGHDRVVTLTIGARTISEYGDLHTMFAEAPIDRSGQVYLAARDAARLFGLTLSDSGKLVFHRPVELSSNTQIVEVAAPPTPHPTATPRSNRTQSNGGTAANSNAGRVIFSLDRIGSANMLSIQGATQGSYLHTNLNASGINGLDTPDATVIIGNAQRNASLGYITDPLSGLIFGGGAYTGANLYNNGFGAFIGRRLDNGYSSFGAIFARPQSGVTDTLDILTNGSSYAETILKQDVVQRESWGEFTREYVLGTEGAGVGLAMRTRGRTFFESTVTYATKGLPLGPNDAPIRMDVGHQLSSATTLAAGFEETAQSPLSPYVAISTHLQNFLAGVSVTNHSLTGSLAYRTANADFSGYTVPGVSHASGLQGTYYFPGLTVDAQQINALGDVEAFVEARTNRPGVNLVTGVGFPSGGHAGPIGGLSIPLSSMLSIEGTLRPSASGPYRLHLAISANIGRRRGPSEPMVAANVRVLGVSPAHPVRVFVDGSPAGTHSSESFTVQVTKGVHQFSSESVDGSTGSQDVSVNVQTAGDTVAMTLAPERSVRGHVVLASAAVTPDNFTLGGMTVLIEPGDITAETNADGTFFFPRQPIPEGATIALDPGSMPRTLQPGPAATLGIGDIQLTLLPGLPVEKQVFPQK